jgi:hypothetical protein
MVQRNRLKGGNNAIQAHAVCGINFRIIYDMVANVSVFHRHSLVKGKGIVRQKGVFRQAKRGIFCKNSPEKTSVFFTKGGARTSYFSRKEKIAKKYSFFARKSIEKEFNVWYNKKKPFGGKPYDG